MSTDDTERAENSNLELPIKDIKDYLQILGNPDDFKPQVKDAVVSMPGVNIYQRKFDGNIEQIKVPIYRVSLDTPGHRAAVSGLAVWFAEHLNLAISANTDSLGIRQKNGYYLQFGTDEVNDQFIRNLPEELKMGLATIKERTGRYEFDVIFMTRRDQRGIYHEPVLVTIPTYQTENKTIFGNLSDEIFFGDLYNDILVGSIAKDNQMLFAQFFAKFALAGFPIPNRKTRPL